jgi:CRISPR-associated endonuclease/helicase Cas3
MVTYKPSSLITVLKKGSTIVEEYAPPPTTGGIPLPVVLQYQYTRTASLAQALAEYHQGAYVLWIENTVSEAQETYDYFNNVAQHVGLLHSRFTVSDRQQKEEQWISRLGKSLSLSDRQTQPCILVGTQVCEQSLDIDADVLYTSVCPMDMLIQRIGRVWRHRKFDPVRQVVSPVVNWFGWDDHSIVDTLDAIDTITNPMDLSSLKKDWKSLYVYAPYVIAKSIEILSAYSQVSIPGDIRKLLEETYA